MIWYEMHCANSNVLSNTSDTKPLFIARLNWLAFAWFGIRLARPSVYFHSHHNCSCFYFILCIPWTITWFTQPRPPTSYLIPTIRHRKMHHVRAFYVCLGLLTRWLYSYPSGYLIGTGAIIRLPECQWSYDCPSASEAPWRRYIKHPPRTGNINTTNKAKQNRVDTHRTCSLSYVSLHDITTFFLYFRHFS